LVPGIHGPIHRSANGHLAAWCRHRLHAAARTAWHGSRGVVGHAVRDRCDVFRGPAPV